jgi:ketosteroid isomerase-like protein
MSLSRRSVLGVASGIFVSATRAGAQPKSDATEASLREAIAQYLKAWNRHDTKAWSAMLTDDIWYTEARDYYQRMKGKKAVLSTFEYNVKNSDLVWEVRRLQMMPDGTATVVVRQVANILPKTGGKYASSFESEPSLARWRHGGGKWRLFFFTSNKGWALAEMKKDGVE